MMSTKVTRQIRVCSVLALYLAACGGDDPSSPRPAAPLGTASGGAQVIPPGVPPVPGAGGLAGTGGNGGNGGTFASGGSGPVAGSGGAGKGGDPGPGSGLIPPPPDNAIAVPPYEQPPGDPERGYDYLVNGDYQRLGPNLAAFKLAAPPIRPEDQIPGRTGENADLSYMFNAATGDDGTKVAAVNCLSCHATQLRGKLTIGLGRPQRMVRTDDVNVLGIALANPLALGSSVNTITRLLGGVSMGVMDVFPYLASHRNAETLVWTDVQQFNPDAGVQGWVDIPPWWRAKKKNALYSNGSGRGVQGHHMSFMSIFSVKDTTEAAKIEKNFDDVGAYIRTIEPPPFPGTIDQALAAQGREQFISACASCHGTYGEKWTYPNLIIPHQEVGTDSSLATGHWMTPSAEWYGKSWYAREGKSWIEIVEGYYAPPLDGIWATAPFFHNGSVPTLDAVIDSRKRLAVWTSDMTADDYDLERVGWMDKPGEVTVTLDNGFGRFDTKVPGNSSKGHNYGDDLPDDAKRALLEYLKTL